MSKVISGMIDIFHNPNMPQASGLTDRREFSVYH